MLLNKLKKNRKLFSLNAAILLYKIKFKNLVVAHSLGGRVGVWGGYGEGGVGRREIMCGCGLRKEREWWWL